MRSFTSHPVRVSSQRRAILQRAKVRALLVTNLTNLRYLTGRSFSVGCMLIEEQRATLFVDARYEQEVGNLQSDLIAIRPPEALSQLFKTLRTCGFEGEDVTMSRMARWKRKFKNTKFVQTQDVIEWFRRRKDSRERASIQRACTITRRLLREIPRMLRAGIRESELAWTIESRARLLGAEEMAFPMIVGFGEHTSSPHHRPTARKLVRGDLVQIDLGVKVGGYCSDFSRVFFTMSPTSEQRYVLRALKRAQREAKKHVRAGVSNHALDRIARSALRSVGFDQEFCHALGHGVGLEIHEGVTLSRKAPRTRLRRGEVITLEPGVYLPGKWGMRVEDTVIVR